MSERVLAQPQSVNAPAKAVKDSFSLEHREKKESEQTTLPELLFDIGLGTFAEPRVGFDFSRVPALTGMERQTPPLLQTQPTTETAEQITETPASALIVEDSTTELGPGQMKKSEFLSQLKIEVCRTVEAAIAGTGRTTDECPYIDYWFDFYSRKESTHIERTIHRYAPEAANVTTAIDYIPVFTQRARQAAETWARTGKITGVPEGLPMSLPGMGLLGGIGRLFSGVGSIFFKARNGGVRKPGDPRAIQAELGEGRPLDSSVRSRMESAFGMDFSHVHTHTDSAAAGLSDRMNARAFTVGEHVAFGTNEYKPGTFVGDALIAHELAHVVQQSGANSPVVPMETGDAGDTTLEKDADRSALGVIVSLWSGAKSSLADIGQNAIPRMRSGLRLQHCRRGRQQPPQQQPQQPQQKQPQPQPPAFAISPQVCVPSTALKWEDFKGTPTGTYDAHTKYDHDLKTVKEAKIIRAVFDSDGSWGKDKFKYPTDRTKTECGAIVTHCEGIFSSLAPGEKGTLPMAPSPGTCAASAKPDTSKVATSKSTCSSVLGAECDRVRTAESKRLLRHEQLHFKIGCVLAQKGTNALAGNSKLDAEKVLSKVIDESNRLSVGGPDNLYDVETSHGCDAESQATWESNVKKGLPDVNIP